MAELAAGGREVLRGAREVLPVGREVLTARVRRTRGTKAIRGRCRLAWDELTGLEFEERYLATVKAGVPVPRKLQRVLVLNGRSASLTVQEPPTAAGKARVVDALAAVAPEAWRGRIRTMGAGW